jgi:hypothetical protein
VIELREALSPTLLAAIAGVSDAKAVGEWARGRRKPAPEALARLRDAHHVLTILRRHEAPDTIRAWFRGMNPDLEDKSPALTLRENPQAVLAAARAFVDSPKD